MKVRQPFLPLGFGRVHWDTLSPEVRAKVLELWIQLLREHLPRQGGFAGRGGGVMIPAKITPKHLQRTA